LPLIFISPNPQSVAFQRRDLVPAPRRNDSCEQGSAMRSNDLMCPDLLSEIVLVGVGMLIVILLLLFIVAAHARA
jgi:uncharacterized integral membrane protein